MDLDARFVKMVDRASGLEGTLYRSAAPQYANSTDLLTGEGSRRQGARWNPVGVATVYGSFTPETALAETLAHAHYYSLPVHASMPRTFVAIEFALSLVLDLTEGRNRRTLRISEKRMLDCDWRAEMRRNVVPVTQQVGQAAFRAGLEAILVPSAADHLGNNLVIYVENLRSDSTLAVITPDRL